MEAKLEQEYSPRLAKRRFASQFATKRVKVTMHTAEQAGLTEGKKGKRLSGRTTERLVQAAAKRSGLEGSDLLEYALAKVALEDDFAEKLIALEGTVSRNIDLEF
jgi:hypothetical protein